MVRLLPLIAAFSPLVGITLAYWLGAQHEHLPNCNPWLDGCTSISSTGRYPPGDRVFRAILLPQAAWLALTWYFAVLWLRAHATDLRGERIILPVGVAGAVALVFYVSYLTSNDPFYLVMKTYGIYLYFIGTALAQVAVTALMVPSRLRNIMLFLCIAPFALGLVNFAQKAMITDINSIENRIEWISSLLMQLWFIALYVAWRRTGFSIVVRSA